MNEEKVHVPRGNRLMDRVAEGCDYADSNCYNVNKTRHREIGDQVPWEGRVKKAGKVSMRT